MSGTLILALAIAAAAALVVLRWYVLPWVRHDLCGGLGCRLCGFSGKRMRLGSRLLYKALGKEAK